MRHPLILSLCILCVVIIWSADLLGKDARVIRPAPPAMMAPQPTHHPLPPDILSAYPKIRPNAAADTFSLAEYDFDTNGMPDAQGWVSVDRTTQLDTFFHVADGTELDGGGKGRLLPLEGLQSMWCGIAPNSGDPYCGWAALPGYGNEWDQLLETNSLSCDSLHFSYLVSWDSEVGYDKTFVQYYDDAAQAWVDLPVDGGVGYYEGEGGETESFSLGTEISNDVTRLRLRFVSDSAWSDEDGDWDTDGAVTIDSVVIERYSGGLLIGSVYEDFEDEDPGSKQTDDGMWTALVSPAFGDYAALHSGFGVLQELRDPLCVSPNVTFMWGFFDDPMVTNYACGQHPEQGAIPYMTGDGVYMWNEVWSPKIAYAGSGVETILEYSVYEDGPFDPLVFPIWGVRSWVDGCPSLWQWYDFIYFVPKLGWARHRWDVSGFVAPGATHVQISLGAIDMCEQWCGIYGSICHSHAPLYDDVKLYRVDNAGPDFNVRHQDLFQDNFSEDGTLDGTARADMAVDVLPASNSAVLPGDSMAVTVDHPEGLAVDPHTGLGPAVYAYVSVTPLTPSGKSGPDIEASETRSIRKRYPLVDSLLHDATWWYRYRMDTVRVSNGSIVEDRYAFDLNDAVFTPGDEIVYFVGAKASNGVWTFWSREYDGQGYGFTTETMTDALESPCEFAILPKAGLTVGSNILYVDAADGLDGPAQLYFDSAFDLLGLDNRVDRYDVLAPSSQVDNSLASRVNNIPAQILDTYQTIIWSTGGNSWWPPISDEVTAKSSDFGLLYRLLDEGMSNPGVYITGDDAAEEWVSQPGADAFATRSVFCSFNLVNGDHVSAGEAISLILTATGECFEDGPGVPDEMVVYGGCPTINDFDVLVPTGPAVTQFPYPFGAGDALISQATPNTAGSVARVILSGYSYHYIRDPGPVFPPARVEHLQHILECLENQDPNTGAGGTPLFVSYLDDNFPNPFNPTTKIRYGFREKTHVSLKIYNAAGQLLRTLVNEVQSPRAEGFEVEWNGRNDAGQHVASGVYFYRIVAGEFVQTKKMVLLK